MHRRVCACGRLSTGSRQIEPKREKVHPDDLKNPEYRKGRYKPLPSPGRAPIHRPPVTEEARRAQFAMQTARVEFGRFYWSDKLAERMKQELANTRRRNSEDKEARRRRRNGVS
jgi:hypothetical protein